MPRRLRTNGWSAPHQHGFTFTAAGGGRGLHVHRVVLGCIAQPSAGHAVQGEMEGLILDNPATSKGVPRADAVASATRNRGSRLRAFRGYGQLAAGRARSLASRRTAGRSRARGQSLVEFALILPILLLLALIAVDFGRIYLGWINLQNEARIAADFGA